MGSSRRASIQVLVGALLFAGAAAGGVASLDSPRLLVLFALLGLFGCTIGGLALRRLQIATSPPPAAPEFASDGAALARRLALLESLLEQQPVALWMQQGAGAVEPLNARARRLIAPGGVQDREALLVRLAALQSARGHELLQLAAERGDERWLLSSNRLDLAGEATRLLAMLPVESELEAEHLRAWRQLVQVLTHEIMNSLTPIASLSRTAQQMLGEPGSEQDLALALDTVARRAESLTRFVGDYRQVSELPAPAPEPVALSALFARLEALVGDGWRARGGTARFELEPASLSLMADPGQLEQALLNLIKNAAEATAGLSQPSLLLRARLARGGRLTLEVRDNGPGVPAGLEQRIFTPFFSTRERGSGSSSGIGLAVVRQLVHGMGGTVRHVRPASGGACFVISF